MSKLKHVKWVEPEHKAKPAFTTSGGLTIEQLFTLGGTLVDTNRGTQRKAR